MPLRQWQEIQEVLWKVGVLMLKEYRDELSQQQQRFEEMRVSL